MKNGYKEELTMLSILAFLDNTEKQQFNEKFLDIYKAYLDTNLNAQNYYIFNNLFNNLCNFNNFYNSTNKEFLKVFSHNKDYISTELKKLSIPLKQLFEYIQNNLPFEYKQKELIKKNSIKNITFRFNVIFIGK